MAVRYTQAFMDKWETVWGVKLRLVDGVLHFKDEVTRQTILEGVVAQLDANGGELRRLLKKALLEMICAEHGISARELDERIELGGMQKVLSAGIVDRAMELNEHIMECIEPWGRVGAASD